MPIPHEQVPPEPKRVLIDEAELEALRLASERYNTIATLNFMQFRAIKREEANGFLTFGELIDQLTNYQNEKCQRKP